jgi:hypothetical protein
LYAFSPPTFFFKQEFLETDKKSFTTGLPSENWDAKIRWIKQQFNSPE